ncbi:right-handed parallel beta-helix repeat-containing protein [Methanosarcina barkeri]|uniref:Cell surface protein n=2 Tax=Methanosarcina barkeri TaxID=2208 RepID=A0A0G3CCL5_METBA|nr:NosD domain-containing protein [Methanosarcina barkeri]AKB57083.1 cell surface protein [Methanosarcina barkeri 227]AKJ37648.1 cell surface protein [Methanosarcina barkeri CM1]
MPLSQINQKIILVLFLVFVISALYILSANKEKYSDTFLGNDNSSITNVHPGDSIQQAINNTSPCGTVTVYPGLYKENLVVNRPLIIISNPGETNNTIVQAADPEEDVFNVTADNVTISGFNIKGTTSKAGIYCSGSGGNITGNKLSYNNYGVYLNDSNRSILENNEVNNNSVGIYLRNSSNNQLKSNKISCVGIFVGLDNNATGIYLEDSDNNKLMSSTISKLWDGVNLTDSSNNELNNNSILQNYFSLSLINSNNNKVLNNTIEKLGYSYSVVLANSQNNTLQGNTASPNTEIKVFYSFDSKNNTFEGERYTVNEQGSRCVYRER